MRSPRARPRVDATSTMGRIATLWAISMSATIRTGSGEVGINLSGLCAMLQRFPPMDGANPAWISLDRLIGEAMGCRIGPASWVVRPFGGIDVAWVDLAGPHGTHVRTARGGAHALRHRAEFVAFPRDRQHRFRVGVRRVGHRARLRDCRATPADSRFVVTSSKARRASI